MKHLGYILFISIFVAECAAIACHPDALSNLQWWHLVLLGFAGFRGGRSITYNAVFVWLREPFVNVVADSSGAGDGVEPKYSEGLLGVISECLCCPICTSTHTVSATLTMVTLAPSCGYPVLFALGAAGIAESLHWWSENQEWAGRNQREQAGSEWLRKN